MSSEAPKRHRSYQSRIPDGTCMIGPLHLGKDLAARLADEVERRRRRLGPTSRAALVREALARFLQAEQNGEEVSKPLDAA